MATPVELPKLGNTVEECLLTRWVKRKGDTVSEGEVVAEIETDKTNFEITAPVAGTVLETFFEEGALVPVFANLFVIGRAGESVAAFRPQGAGAPAVQAEETAVAGSGLRTPDSGPEARRPQPEAHQSVSPWSPRARRFAAERGLEAASIVGSGPGGRVLEDDVRRVLIENQSRPSSLAPSAKGASGFRDTIARRMRESLASTAQYTMNASADATGLLALRARIKKSENLPDININDLVTFCTIRALVEVPDLNAEYINGKIVKHSEVHLGFACDTPRGLMVPVIRNADQLPAGELAICIKDLTIGAVQGTISPNQLSGATFTISNLGGLGIESFTPLINPPQVAILGVGAIELKPIRRNGTVEFLDAIGLSLTCDHQVIDGAPGARFLQVLKEKIASVESLLEGV
jgi:pyruvate dehydrogenase E2 component (dihydrolipoyllysine-residue acetyltransferase)